MLVALVLAATALKPQKWVPIWVFSGNGTWTVSGTAGTTPNSYVGNVTVTSASGGDLTAVELLSDNTYVQITMFESSTLHPLPNCQPTYPSLGVAQSDPTESEAAFASGCIAVVDNFTPSPAFLRKFHLPKPKKKTRGLSKFRVRRARGAQNTTFAGYGTSYTVCYYPTNLPPATSVPPAVYDNDCFDVYVTCGSVQIAEQGVEFAPVPTGQGLYVSSDGTSANQLIPATYSDGGKRCN